MYGGNPQLDDHGGADSTSTPQRKQDEENGAFSHIKQISEQHLLLPQHNISNIMKQAMSNACANTGPDSSSHQQPLKISDDAKKKMQQFTSELVSFVAAEAIDNCVTRNRKKLVKTDITEALQELDFEEYLEVLNVFLQDST